MTIKLEDGRLIVRETHKGSTGGDYTYIIRDSKLVHISKFFGLSKRTAYEITYEIPIIDAERILGQEMELLEFSFSNTGTFFSPIIYRIDLRAKTLNRVLSRDQSRYEDRLKEVLRYKFEILGDEYHAIKEYERKVPPLIKRVREIEKNLNLSLHIWGTRGREVHEDPELGKFNSLVFPNPRSRTRSLKEKIRFAHELYVLMLVVDSVLKASAEERTLWITHEDSPTLVVDDLRPQITVWYQFSIKDWTEVVWGLLGLREQRYFSRSVKNKVIKMITEGNYEGAEKLLGIKLPRTYSESMKVLESMLPFKKIHVKPDIMVFKGEYHSRDDLLQNPPDKAVLIDAKVGMTENDLKQLKEYRDKFPETFENIEFIVAAIEKIPAHYKYKLEGEGYRVIENVFPGRSGEKEFQEVLQNITEMWE